jgi:hypothetical protein
MNAIQISRENCLTIDATQTNADVDYINIAKQLNKSFIIEDKVVRMIDNNNIIAFSKYDSQYRTVFLSTSEKSGIPTLPERLGTAENAAITWKQTLTSHFIGSQLYKSLITICDASDPVMSAAITRASMAFDDATLHCALAPITTTKLHLVNAIPGSCLTLYTNLLIIDEQQYQLIIGLPRIYN